MIKNINQGASSVMSSKYIVKDACCRECWMVVARAGIPMSTSYKVFDSKSMKWYFLVSFSNLSGLKRMTLT